MPTCQWLVNATWWVVAHDVYNAGMAPIVGVFSEDLAEICMFTENSATQTPLFQRTAVQARVKLMLCRPVMHSIPLSELNVAVQTHVNWLPGCRVYSCGLSVLSCVSIGVDAFLKVAVAQPQGTCSWCGNAVTGLLLVRCSHS
jgi:hypothetical protein